MLLLLLFFFVVVFVAIAVSVLVIIIVGTRNLALKFSPNQVSNSWNRWNAVVFGYCYCYFVHVTLVNPRNLPLLLGQNWGSNSWDIADVEFTVVVVGVIICGWVGVVTIFYPLYLVKPHLIVSVNLSQERGPYIIVLCSSVPLCVPSHVYRDNTSLHRDEGDSFRPTTEKSRHAWVEPFCFILFYCQTLG